MRQSVLTLLVSVTAAAVLWVPATTSGAVIGIDDRSAGPTGPVWREPAYGPFRDEVAAAGHTLTPRGSFNESDLAGIDALLLLQPMYPHQAFLEQEIADVHGFVARGGGLIVIGEGGWESDATVENLNALVSPYGVAYGNQARAGGGTTVTGFNAHPLTEGVETIGLDFYRALGRVDAPAIDLTSGAINVLAAVQGAGGAGNVLFLSDLSGFAGPSSDRPLSFGDNRQLLQNVLRFAAIPEPGTGALLLVALGPCAMRRRGARDERPANGIAPARGRRRR